MGHGSRTPAVREGRDCMALSTNLISGLASGFDWRTAVDQLIQIERAPVNQMTARKRDTEAELTAWQSFNTKLLSLKSAAETLKDHRSFYLYSANASTDSATVQASDLITFSTTDEASPGSYDIVVKALATAQKLSSRSFTDTSGSLGAAYTGDILINGAAVSISAADSLRDVRDKINNANSGTRASGVLASIVHYGPNDDRLILTAQDTGASGISLLNGSSADLLELFGWKDGTASLKNAVTGGGQSDALTSSTQAVKTLLGLSTTQSGTIQIRDGNGAYQDVAVDLSTDSLETIRSKINDASIAGVSASIVTETSGGTTTYRLQVNGSQDFLDDQNILETLGILHNGVSDVQGTRSANAMTAKGQAMDGDTLLTDLDGYGTYTAGDSITLSGKDHDNNDVSSLFTITEASTVQDLLDAVEAAFGNVLAYVTSEGKVEVADMQTDAGSLSVSLSATIQDAYSSLDWGAFSALGTVRERELVQAGDALLELDGVEITSQDNVLDDLLPGVTLNLRKADAGTTVSLNVERDVDAVMGKMESFVEAYNGVASFIRQQQSYDTEKQSPGGVLFGDGTLSSVKSDLTGVLLQSVWGVSQEYSTMGLMGIRLDNEGHLSIDRDTLRGYLNTNFNDVRDLFAVRGTSSAGALEYVGSTRDTRSGQYVVHITQAAARSTATADNAVGATLGTDETLTITEGGSIAEVSLTADMTLSEAVRVINAELDTVHTEKLTGSEALLSGGAAATSAATWASLDGTTLSDGDVVSFTGTTRKGTSVSGSYTISDAASDTLQGLLSAIESAFNSEVTAGMDGSGHIVVTDKTQGASGLSLVINEPDGKGLEFGTVLTTNEGGQEGRYAMTITASAEGGRLILSHESYGSAYGFSVSETANVFWSADQAVDNGKDVAGTINGESATGSGQVLTGDKGQSSVAGLSLRYTGTDQDADVGSLKLTLGVAELFERSLFNITDSFEGYVALKQTSLQGRIDNYDTRIAKMEVRVDLKMETMINRFVAMEKALSTIQNQSAWLTGQIQSLTAMWR